LFERRLLTVLLALPLLVVSCAAPPPASSEQPGTGLGHPAPTATPPPPLGRMRAVSVIGETIAASGDFRGDGKSEIALLQDPTRDTSLRVTVRDSTGDGDSFTDSVWLTLGARSLELTRVKLAVADVDADKKDDLVALYNNGENRSTLLVMRSTGTSFAPPEKWWERPDYSWNRARAIVGGSFSAGGPDGLLVAYQYDDAQMRMHYFEAKGSSFVLGDDGGAFDSGRGQFDAASARFLVGHFTRSGGADQVAALYRYPNARVRLHVFDPSPKGLVLQKSVYESAEGEFDFGRASVTAADVTGDGRDDVVSVYADPDGSARVLVLDSGNGFKPTSAWATLPKGASCAAGTAVLVGDWNGDHKVDLDAVAPGDGVQVRNNVLRNAGGSFKVSSSAEEVVCPRWPLTGLPLNGGPVTRRPLYVKVDNNPTARPHYGISEADQVYEWLVEGLTTRLAAVFHSRTPDVIGSVRSARMTDAPIVPSLGGVFVYSGGGPEELMKLHYDDEIARRYIDLRPGYGWGYRVPFRPAPYNYFTTYGALQSAIAQAPEADQPVTIPSWDFLPPAYADPLAGGFGASAPATAIAVPYRGGFDVRYQYDEGSRTYARFQAGAREVDGANGAVIAARNIVIIQTEVHFTTEWGLDPAGSPKLDMRLVGTGRGSVFRDGKRMDVTWSRPDIFDVFQLKTPNGEAVRLAPGQTWIHIIPNDWAVPSQ
jgi:hypothetical protein